MNIGSTPFHPIIGSPAASSPTHSQAPGTQAAVSWNTAAPTGSTSGKVGASLFESVFPGLDLMNSVSSAADELQKRGLISD